MANMEFKSCQIKWKADAETGEIEGYGAVFGNVDSTGDVIQAGAFAGAITPRGVKMLWQHDPAHPIGVWDEVREDATGLWVKGRIFTAVDKGREALALLDGGAIDGLSIGYRTVKAERDADGIRYIKELKLWEVSIVTFPANEMATARVKSIETERDLERLLIDNGMSRKNAKAIAAQSKGYLDQRDADAENPDEGLRDADLIEALKSLQATLKG